MNLNVRTAIISPTFNGIQYSYPIETVFNQAK